MMKQKMAQQAGFTLIELVVVIVILGILAATALPRFVDLTGDANRASVAGIAGAINGGNSINFATYLARRSVADGSVATLPVDSVIDTRGGCTLPIAQSLLGAGSVNIQAVTNGTNDYSITGPTTLATVAAVGPPAVLAAGTCILTHAGSNSSATFTLNGAR